MAEDAAPQTDAEIEAAADERGKATILGELLATLDDGAWVQDDRGRVWKQEA